MGRTKELDQAMNSGLDQKITHLKYPKAQCHLGVQMYYVTENGKRDGYKISQYEMTPEQAWASAAKLARSNLH